ncbi:hypothetical protein [Paraburkholderia sp. SIMBA_054]|uniref:hypothetical protein n=1 Tax=Paraburkholderia sp. SIMBA_054 TaxID=3085795 RepID=UPI00397C030D
MPYLMAVMCLTIAFLLFLCHRFWQASQAAHPVADMYWSTEKHLQEARRLVIARDEILAQLGELLDHCGVALEVPGYTQYAHDLKVLGGILRRRIREEGLEERADVQQALSQIAGRYGFEPNGGNPPVIGIHTMVRVAEEIIEPILRQRTSAPPISTLQEDPAVSFWLKDAAKSLLIRDAVDALADAEILAAMARARLGEALGAVPTGANHYLGHPEWTSDSPLVTKGARV